MSIVGMGNGARQLSCRFVCMFLNKGQFSSLVRMRRSDQTVYATSTHARNVFFSSVQRVRTAFNSSLEDHITQNVLPVWPCCL